MTDWEKPGVRSRERAAQSSGDHDQRYLLYQWIKRYTKELRVRLELSGIYISDRDLGILTEMVRTGLETYQELQESGFQTLPIPRQEDPEYYPEEEYLSRYGHMLRELEMRLIDTAVVVDNVERDEYFLGRDAASPLLDRRIDLRSVCPLWPFC
jgi:hypothetical protein